MNYLNYGLSPGPENKSRRKQMKNTGESAPDFILPGIDEEGNERTYSLSDLLKKSKPLVLYFYPKDNTSGCTQEACDFRDSMNRITAKAAVAGVSADSIASHIKFRAKQGINFPLLSDPGHEILKAYGVWQQKKMAGRNYMGIVRTTLIIGSDGKLEKIWPKVKVKGHVDEVLGYLGE